jgi:PPOX class probable F420-dependent enzyme
MADLAEAAYIDLLERPINCLLITVTPTGKPHASVMWRMYEKPYIWMSTLAGTVKIRNIRHNPYVIVLTFDPQIPYRYLQINGVVEHVFPDTDHADLDRLTQFYLGKPFSLDMLPMTVDMPHEYVTIQILVQKIVIYAE